MQGYCSVCGLVVADGEKVRFEVEGEWENIPSEAAFAISKEGFEYVPFTFRHADCEKRRGQKC